LKVLHIIPNLKKGGAERLTLDICRSLQKKGVDVRLVYLEDINHYHYLTNDIKTKLISASVSLSILRKPEINVNELQQFIEEFQPDIIHTHLFKSEIVSRHCYFPRAKWFTHIHDNIIQLNNWTFPTIPTKVNITNFYEKKLLFNLYKKNGGTHFIAISNHTKEFINKVQKTYSVTLIYNAIDSKRFLKKNLNLTENKNSEKSINIINIGSYLKKKNQLFLLEIVNYLKQHRFQVQCSFLGDGPLKQEVEERAKEMNIYNQCQFLGNVENVEEYLWKSDVYVHTATYEPLGLVILEAMAAGLPVVTLDGGGNRDLIENGKNGFILTEQDSKLFAEKILEVKDNEEMKRYNVQFAQQFDIDNYTDKLLGLYNESIEFKNF
jgi:glycosyltransferase involved in cell wall biosynthesis